MSFSWELSKFDTEILGFEVAKITYRATEDEDNVKQGIIQRLQKDLEEKGIVYATCRVNAGQYSIIQNLEKNRFLLVDELIKLERETPFQGEIFSSISVATRDDFPQLAKITSTVFNGVSRYYHDPKIISKKQAGLIYKKWIENSVNRTAADLVLVWKEKGVICGFITLTKKGQIPLIGVSENARGKGIGKGLLFAAFQQFLKWRIEKVIIETQMSNIAALGFYQKCGFRIVDSYLTYRWHVRA